MKPMTDARMTRILTFMHDGTPIDPVTRVVGRRCTRDDPWGEDVTETYYNVNGLSINVEEMRQLLREGLIRSRLFFFNWKGERDYEGKPTVQYFITPRGRERLKKLDTINAMRARDAYAAQRHEHLAALQERCNERFAASQEAADDTNFALDA